MQLKKNRQSKENFQNYVFFEEFFRIFEVFNFQLALKKPKTTLHSKTNFLRPKLSKNKLFLACLFALFAQI